MESVCAGSLNNVLSIFIFTSHFMLYGHAIVIYYWFITLCLINKLCKDLYLL